MVHTTHRIRTPRLAGGRYKPLRSACLPRNGPRHFSPYSRQSRPSTAVIAMMNDERAKRKTGNCHACSLRYKPSSQNCQKIYIIYRAVSIPLRIEFDHISDCPHKRARLHRPSFVYPLSHIHVLLAFASTTDSHSTHLTVL